MWIDDLVNATDDPIITSSLGSQTWSLTDQYACPGVNGSFTPLVRR